MRGINTGTAYRDIPGGEGTVLCVWGFLAFLLLGLILPGAVLTWLMLIAFWTLILVFAFFAFSLVTK